MDHVTAQSALSQPKARHNWARLGESENIHARLAINETTRREAYALRHDGYLSHGYIDARPDGLFSDKYDEYANSKTIVVYKNFVPAGSVRVCVFDPSSQAYGADQIPAADIFRKEILELLRGLRPGGQMGRAVEITRLTRHPDFASDNEIVSALFRIAGYLVLEAQADAVLSAVRPNHAKFYRRMGFQKIEEPREYPGLNFLTGLMACFLRNYEGVKQSVSILEAVSLEDDAYAALNRGDLISVFPKAPTFDQTPNQAGIMVGPGLNANRSMPNLAEVMHAPSFA